MRKIIFIFVIVTLSACSVLKREGGKDISKREPLENGDLMKFVLRQNLSNSGFFISKAQVTVTTDGEKTKFIASVKFEYPDRYLISLKSKSGIEAARIFISSDTILINDRINRKLYHGRADYLNFKYGIPVKLLPGIFGDLVLPDNTKSLEGCSNNLSKLDYIGSGVKYSYIIDCRKGKVIELHNFSQINSKEVVVNFNKFLDINSILYPSIINFIYSGNEVNIKIDRLEYPWNGNVEFISGNRYELIDLK